MSTLSMSMSSAEERVTSACIGEGPGSSGPELVLEVNKLKMSIGNKKCHTSIIESILDMCERLRERDERYQEHSVYP